MQQGLPEVEDQNIWLVKSNDLITASYRLTILEQRIVSLMLSKVDSVRKRPLDEPITIEANELKRTYPRAYEKNRNVFADLMKGADRLQRRLIRCNYGMEKVELEQFYWISHLVISEERQLIAIYITPEIRRRVSFLSGAFTKYKLGVTHNFKKVHSYRIYEFLTKWQKVGKAEIGLEELKEMLGVSGKYSEFADFNRLVLNPTHKEIHQETKLRYTVEYIKERHKVAGLRFRIQRKRRGNQVKN